MNEPIIYLDMDGVCCDFIKSAVELHGFEHPAVMKEWEETHEGEFYPPESIFKTTKQSFWQNITNEGERFWTGLPEFPWFQEMFDELNNLGQVYFLSSPTLSPFSLSGKLHWLQARFGRRYREFIFTPQKHLLAAENTILIDDFEWNVDSFTEHGGSAVLFPQIWNRNYPHKDDPSSFTIESVKEWVETLNASVESIA